MEQKKVESETTVDENWIVTKGNERHRITFDSIPIRTAIEKLTPPFVLPEGYEAVKTEALHGGHVFKICKVESPGATLGAKVESDVPNSAHSYTEGADVPKEDVYQMGEDYSIKQHGEIDVDTRRAFIAGHNKASKELRAELEKLREENAGLSNIITFSDDAQILIGWKDSYAKLEAERNKLREYMDAYTVTLEHHVNVTNELKADNERLKEKLNKSLIPVELGEMLLGYYYLCEFEDGNCRFIYWREDYYKIKRAWKEQ